MSDTKIEWAEKVWNPVTGCTKISEGCKNCYAKRMSKRLAGRFGYHHDNPFQITYHDYRLEDPMHWEKPKRIFVCSMGDLFHEDVRDEYIFQVLNTCISAKKHTFLILTKRPEIMKDVLSRYHWWNKDNYQNIWLGVTAENQEQANKRIPMLLHIPAAKRFVSIEPMLGPIDLREAHKAPTKLPRIDWVICGCESGPSAREMKREWAWQLMDQCSSKNVPFFYKQGPDDNGNIIKMPKLTGIVWDRIPEP